MKATVELTRQEAGSISFLVRGRPSIYRLVDLKEHERRVKRVLERLLKAVGA